MEVAKNFTQSKIARSLFVVLLGTILLAISAKIKIPFYPVPMTMQTFVILVIGIGFGWKLGVTTVLLYLFEGMIGLPVFSGTPEKGIGLVYFTGPTMGYLIGFISACALASFIKVDDNYFIIFTKLILSVLTIYVLGVLWLGTLIGWDKPVIQLGVTPFLLAEIFKIALLTILAKKIFKLRKFI